MYKYQVAFMVNGKQLNAWFESPVEFTADESSKNRFRTMARTAVQDYLNKVRSIPRTGQAEALALWPEILPSEGVIQPLDAFELND